ncbi:AraC family transcriptional regulator [Adhaeribacter aquaticus]|uniref:AraC family transcriptional regulator n=1 Tax=Adhaeribacter aquaticus TaxID=299567 RepID=UPI000407BF93|nr:AraC family transcriptional regulator [Adhaeribacter aquaticus]
MRSALHKSEIPASKAYIINYLDDPFFDTNWHAHSEYQLFVVLQGTGTRFIGDNISHFQEGDLVFTGPHVPHLWRNDDFYFNRENKLRVKGIVIYFPEHLLSDSLLHKEEMLEIHQLFEKAKRGLSFKGQTVPAVTQMMWDLIELKGVEGIIQLLAILHQLAEAKDFNFISSVGYINSGNEKDNDRMREVYNFIMKNFKRDIMLEEVADLANMSPTAFSRYFKSRTNKPFSAFLSELRISFACKLLMEDKDSIAQICYECGFNTLSNFNKQFKDFTGTSPLKYKQEYLKVAGF